MRNLWEAKPTCCKFLIAGLNDASAMRGDQTLSVLPGSSPDDDAVQPVKVGLGGARLGPSVVLDGIVGSILTVGGKGRSQNRPLSVS